MGLEVYQNNDQALDDAFSKDNKEKAGNFSSTYWLKKGNTMLRVLPTWKPDGLWYKEFSSHFVNKEIGTVICPRFINQPCPLCDHGKSLHEVGQSELAKSFRPTKKFLCNAFVLSDSGETTAKDGVKAVEFGVKVKRQLLNYDRNRESGWGDITSIEAGNNVTISRTGDGLGTEYIVTPFPQKTNVALDLHNQGINIQEFTMNDLDALINNAVKSYEELSGMVEAITATPGFEPPAPAPAPQAPAPQVAMPQAPPAPQMPAPPAPTQVTTPVPAPPQVPQVPQVPVVPQPVQVTVPVPDIPAPPNNVGWTSEREERQRRQREGETNGS